MMPWILPGYRLMLQPVCDPELRSAPEYSNLVITPGLMPFFLHTMLFFSFAEITCLCLLHIGLPVPGKANLYIDDSLHKESL